MTQDDQLNVPDSLINFPHLRLLAQDRLTDPSNTPLTPRERILIGHLVGLESLDPDTKRACVGTLSHLFETKRLPRYQALILLLSPISGYLACWPLTLARLARYLLDWQGAQQKEHARFDWKALANHYPQLFDKEHP